MNSVAFVCAVGYLPLGHAPLPSNWEKKSHIWQKCNLGEIALQLFGMFLDYIHK